MILSHVYIQKRFSIIFIGSQYRIANHSRGKGMTTGSIYNYITSKLKEGSIHMTLLDPATTSAGEIGAIGAMAQEAGTSAIMVGGSTHLSAERVDEAVLALRKETSLPIILFPPSASTLSKYADALYFMSMLNSTNIQFIVGEQLKGAPLINKLGLEPIPMGYILVEPGMTVAKIGQADLIKRDQPERAVNYSLMAQYLGMRIVYLEAGSGAPEPIPTSMVKAVKEKLSIPLIVGGGIRTPEQAGEIVKAGADIIVTGTLVEETDDVVNALEPLIRKIGL
jgi:phosphoglycerol geranylgeranyltransferase